MYTIETTSNANEVLSQLIKIEPNVRQAVIDSVNYTAELAISVETAKLWGHNKVGKLAQIRTGEMSQTIVPIKPYLVIQEKGRGTVYPVVKKALWWEGLPHPIPSAGPVKADPFVKPAYEKAMVMFPIIMQAKVNKALQGSSLSYSSFF